MAVASRGGLDATETSAPRSPATPPRSPAPEARFSPGTMIAERYRIVGLLGRGGMGEVYRADDLTLGRPVALKFLPEAVERDPGRLARLLNEVRTALAVSHPNVCRVHDINQVAGRHFISMEFVDGDDLALLLRRIGRFPPDRAVTIARQLCAGLGAAHAAGVLHRDLKPANVMIDGRGQVKITDFGLAGLAGDIEGDEVRAGTPAYMAPEQLAGGRVSAASDVYALGLVLYEVFTGKAAFEGRSLGEVMRRREEAPTSPSSLIHDLDPAVERVILRCLERDPADRPGSALAVGETPAPELVAEAGAAGGLGPRVAVGLLVAVVAGFVALTALGERYSLVSRADLPKSPAVLTEKAREILRDLGHDEPPGDSLHEFAINFLYYRHLVEREPRPGRWEPVSSPQPPVITFGYRQEPGPIVFDAPGAIGDWLARSPPRAPGAVRMRLDPVGRLYWLDVVPPEHESEDGGEVAAADWNALLVAAGFDPARMTPAEPAWLPPSWATERRAWTGVYPDAPDVPIRIEAAAFGGRPVSFRIVEPWTRAREAPVPEAGFWARAGSVLGNVWFFVVLVGASLVAWRNVRLGRGDRRTALRFALLLGALRFVWILGAHHTTTGNEIDLLRGHLAYALLRFGLVYVFYLALEPYARRLWPRMLTSWVRLFDGRLRDPLVGRDLLIGLAYGMLFALGRQGSHGLAEALGLPAYGLESATWSFEAVNGFRGAVAALAGVETTAVLNMFTGLMMIFILRLLLRRNWLMVVVATPLVVVLFNPGQGHPGPYLAAMAVILAVFWFVFFRFGLLPIVAGAAFSELVVFLPLTFDLTAWWSGPTWLVMLFCGGIAGWAFWAALAGRPVFRDQILEQG